VEEYENEFEIVNRHQDKDGCVPVRIKNKRTGKVSVKGNYLRLDLAEKFSRESPIRRVKSLYIRAYLPGKWMYSWVRTDFVLARKLITVFPVISMTEEGLQTYLRNRRR